MITYETWCQIRTFSHRKHMTFAQIAVEMHLNVRTVAKWAILPKYQPRRSAVRASVLDPFKTQVSRLLAAHSNSNHPLSAKRIVQQLQKAGYKGGITIVKDYILSMQPMSGQAVKHEMEIAPPEATEASEFATEKRAATNVYAMRIECAIKPTLSPALANDVSDKSSFQAVANVAAMGNLDVRPDWAREFTALGRHTLEQISDLIQQVLGWDGNHLYEFRITDRVHAHLIFLEEDDLFVDTSGLMWAYLSLSSFSPVPLKLTSGVALRKSCSCAIVRSFISFMLITILG